MPRAMSIRHPWFVAHPYTTEGEGHGHAIGDRVGDGVAGGFSAGPGGDLTGLVEQAGSPETMAWFEGVFRGASTALMGRTNYEGFYGYWPAVARDPESSPRGRDLAVWLDEVEKVVFSRRSRRRSGATRASPTGSPPTRWPR